MYNNLYHIMCTCIIYTYPCINVQYIYIVLVPRIEGSNVMVMENNGIAVVQIERSGPLNSAILIQVTTVDVTAIGKTLCVTLSKYCIIISYHSW